MKRIVLTENEAVSYKEISDLFELTDTNIEDCEIPDLFDCDPDYFNWGIGANHIHKIPFVEVLDKYIIVPDDYLIEAISDYKINGISEKCKNMLVSFFEENFEEMFASVESSWKQFNRLNFGIAYRGDSGYCYSIWKYNNKNK